MPGDDVADIIGVINQAAVSDGHNGLVIDPRVFRENGKEVNLEVNSKKSKSAPKPMKYKEKGTDRAKSRYNHQMGFARKMSEYKISTNDDIFVAFHQSTNKSRGHVRGATTHSPRETLNRHQQTV